LIESIRRLEKLAPRPAELLWLRFVSGLTVNQVAAVLGISRRSVQKDWSFARAWLRRELDDPMSSKAPEENSAP
jgi:RNA polymerase sigma factor (sigma-70 family)